MSTASPLQGLTLRELEAMRGAAVWYAKHHAGAIASCADHFSAYAVAERDGYLDLISALAKRGIRLRVPDSPKQNV